MKRFGPIVVFSLAIFIVGIIGRFIGRSIPVPEPTRAEMPLAQNLIADLKKGHLPACRQSISAQSTNQKLGLSKVEIEAFCKCTGDAYFDGFSVADFEYLTATTRLPNDIERKRQDIQISCLLRAVQ